MSEEKKTTTKGRTTAKKGTAKKKTEEIKPENNTDYEAIILQLQQQINMMQEKIKQQKEVEVKAQSVESETWNKAKLYTIRDEYVNVRSVYDGGVVFVSPKTKLEYYWAEKGDVEILSIEEILTMSSTSPRCLKEPWLIVEDERVIEGLGLGKVMDLVNKIEDIDTLVTMDLDDLEKLINGLTKDQRDNLRDEINKKIENNEIRDYVTVVTLKKILNLD